MQEVTRQLGPLTERVSLLGNSIERLYNSNGGPPGYLQTARAEDNRRFDQIFAILKEQKEEKESQRKEDHRRLERKINVRLTILGLALTAISIISANMQGCRKAASSLIDPSTHSQLTLPQDAGIPPLRTR